MTWSVSIRLTAALACGLLTAACQTGSANTPATLPNADEATLSRVKEVLAQAMGRNDIRLGAGDPTIDTAVTVLPPPLGEHETHSTAVPIIFDIVVHGSSCYLVRRETEESYRLKDVDCQAVAE